LTDNKHTICKVTNVAKSFEKHGKKIHVLRDVNLTIARGDMCSVRGKSGVGKSTLLHILGTLDRPTSGHVEYYGENVFDYPDGELAAFRNKRIGFVFQFHHLLPEFTALENIAMPALIAGEKRSKALRKASDLLDQVKLTHRAQHRPGELSGGEQQRIAVARALVQGPSLVLADEPTGNLDQSTSDEIHDLILSINEIQQIAFLVVTHNHRLATMMTRQLEMRDGVVYEGAA